MRPERGNTAGPVRLRVVHVEDDEVIREVTALGLERLGYAVHGEADGLEGLDYLRHHPADIVLLDVMLPGLSGAALCRRLRAFSDVPVIMLSARHDSVDIVAGLDAGADDYVSKPVDLDVLDARMRALLRRTARGGSETTGAPSGGAPERGEVQPYEANGLELDPARLRLRIDGEPVHLTPTEWRLLLALVDGGGRLVTRERLLGEGWDEPWSGDARLVDVHVQRLRRKVGTHRIETVRGFGYRWHE